MQNQQHILKREDNHILQVTKTNEVSARVGHVLHSKVRSWENYTLELENTPSKKYSIANLKERIFDVTLSESNSDEIKE